MDEGGRTDDLGAECDGGIRITFAFTPAAEGESCYQRDDDSL